MSTSDTIEDGEVQELLKTTGTDLRQYSAQIEKEFKEVENRSIEDYIAQSQNIANLHNQIGTTSNILERMEAGLMEIQSALNNISTEITTLQKKSVSMSVQLTNRQSIRAQLSQFIEDMAVPEEMIQTIMEVPVTEKEFLTHLMELNHKLNLMKELNFKESKSSQDISEVLFKLKIKAMSKLRVYCMEQIYKFRKPMTNYQIPQNAMLKFKFFFEFILSNERGVAQDICNEYIDTMGKIYYSYFKSYSTRLAALKFEEAVSKDDLMGLEDTVTRSIFSKTSSLKNKSTVFSIGDRGDVLNQQLEAPIIVPHAQQKTRYPYESLFRSEQYALVDNACREYLFVTEFFIVRGPQAQELFNQIMGKTMTMLIKNLETYVQDCYDTIALFLCIQLCLRYQLMCHKRCVPALDKYWDNLQAVIWPRFEQVFRMNIQSIQECDPTKFPKETGPHYITRRYAEFSAAIVGISENFPNELVSHLLLELQEEVKCFMLRMAAIFTTRKEQLIYLINNYDLVLGVLMERTRDNSKEAEAFRELLSTRSSEYVEEILAPHLGGIIQYVKDCEQLLEREQTDEFKRQERRSLQLVASFSVNWKKSLEELNREVFLSFPSLVTGSQLLQLALAQLVQYYHKFYKLLTPSARAQLVNIHVIMIEIKKYKSNY
ncbi:vacuolar protein sorting [Culex quinquefasciatus]|uniref:Vacuolar protein sorting-associated protein 52 homolog n=2 Tax=Culex pipiens complex TaxID=518105 RepID=B0WGM0_CULQU|nr:vacuolar protein sorting-associated protein 52 homolog [Culex quinquefasciatus]XP_039443914.1 vacuolar protein sorting-associated protein 52 homolog [Culex pipiens pallens]EDS27049.1 vacuolar protein sorting [Culex quinquefasciatus]|eukprot:XP_001847854.1 vacuolar protein sorting [Culex quinquefasciatus]